MNVTFPSQAAFDDQGSGKLDFDELSATGGLLDYIQRKFGIIPGSDSAKPATAPDIETDRLGWFKCYDDNGDGALDKV